MSPDCSPFTIRDGDMVMGTVAGHGARQRNDLKMTFQRDVLFPVGIAQNGSCEAAGTGKNTGGFDIFGIDQFIQFDFKVLAGVKPECNGAQHQLSIH